MLLFLSWGQWLKRRSLRKQSRTTSLSTHVTDVVSKPQPYASPPSIGSSRSVESSTKRKYSDSYFSLGFTNTGEGIAREAICVSCNEVQSDSSMLPAKLRLHRDTNHSECRDNDISFFFKPNLEALNSSLSLMVKSSETDNKSATEASYTVICRIVIVGEAQSFEETLINPCAMEVTTCVLREQSKKTFFLNSSFI
jgi:hypothetical protein